MKKLLKMLLMLSLLLMPMTLPVKEATAEFQPISVGILQYVEHESLDQNYQGFIKGLEDAGYIEGDNLTLNYMNASGDTANLQSMGEKVLDNDYVFAIATPAAQALANLDSDKPIFFSAVSDPVGSGLVKDLDQPQTNLTGTLDAGPIAEQIDLLQVIVPDTKKVGIIYNAGETNSVAEVEKAKVEFAARGIELIEQTVASTNDISQAMEALINKDIQALFAVTDNTVTSAINLVGSLALENQLPIIGSSKDMILTKGMATYGLDYYKLGYQTAQMLVKMINEDLRPQEMPVEKAAEMELIINEDVAKELGYNSETIRQEMSKN